MISAGIGWAWPQVDDTASLPDLGPDYETLDKDSFTANAGLGLQIRLGGRAFLEPEVRIKWFEARQGDSTDLEGTLALGWNF